MSPCIAAPVEAAALGGGMYDWLEATAARWVLETWQHSGLGHSGAQSLGAARRTAAGGADNSRLAVHALARRLAQGKSKARPEDVR